MLSLIIGLFFDVVSLLLFCVVLFLLIIDNSFLQDLSDYTLYLEKNPLLFSCITFRKSNRFE